MKRLTARGMVVAFTGAAALVAGLAFGSLLAGTLGLALLVALADAVTRAGPTALRVERRISAAIAREGQDIGVEINVVVPMRMRVEIEDAPPAGLVVIEGSARSLAAAFDYRVEARVPGRWEFGVIRLRLRDPLGLVERTIERAVPETVRIYPRAEDMRASPIASRLAMALTGAHATGNAGAGSDFFALRTFQDGDTLRDVNWRASARTGGTGLVVNQREKESQSLVTYFIDVRAVAGAGTRAQNAYVHAARAFVTLASAGAKRRDRARVVVYGSGVGAPVIARAGDAALASVLDPILDHAPKGEATLGAAVDATLHALRPHAPCVIISSFLFDGSVDAAVASLRALDQRVAVVAIHPAPLIRLAQADERAILRAQEEHDTRVRDLRARGARVVDWNATRPLAVALEEEALR